MRIHLLMTELSPATSAILNAYWETFNTPLEGAVHRPLAAALRAAADQLKYKLLDVEVVDCSQLLLLADEIEA